MTNPSVPKSRGKTAKTPKSDPQKEARRLKKEVRKLVDTIVLQMDEKDSDLYPDPVLTENWPENARMVFPLLTLVLDHYAPNGRNLELTPHYQAAMLLAENLLTEIRYATDRRQPWAFELLEDFQKQIADKAFRLEVDTRVQTDLVKALYAAGVPIHSEIREKSEQLAEYYSQFSSGDFSKDVSRIFDAMAEDAVEIPYHLNENFMAELNLMPFEGQLALIAEMVRHHEPAIREMAAFMFLHPDKALRTEMPMLFLHAADFDTLSPVTLRRLIGLRNWLPEDEREGVDEVIRTARGARVNCAPMPTIQSEDTYASTVDGSGIQGLIRINTSARNWNWNSIMIRQGEGVREVWGDVDMHRKDVRRIVRKMATDGAGKPIAPAYANALLSHFIWLGQQNGRPPHPLLLLAAEQTPAGYWYPRPVDMDARMRDMEKQAGSVYQMKLKIAEVLDESRYWPMELDFALSWFEDSAEIDDILSECGFKKNRKIDERKLPIAAEEVLTRNIAPKYEIWKERLFWTALWGLHVHEGLPVAWQQLWVVARELQNGTPLHYIPLMISVALRSVESGLVRMGHKLPEEPIVQPFTKK